jgi:hypothetical protein
MNYTLGKFVAENDTFMFNFDDGRWIEIDFVEYPNYQILSNTLDNEKWYFTVLSDSIGDSIGYNNANNKDKSIGTVKLFNYRELRQIETNIKSFRKNGVLYRKSTQTEFDRFLSQKDDTNDTDNGKLFKLLDTLYNEPKMEVTMV